MVSIEDTQMTEQVREANCSLLPTRYYGVPVLRTLWEP